MAGYIVIGERPLSGIRKLVFTRPDDNTRSERLWIACTVYDRGKPTYNVHNFVAGSYEPAAMEEMMDRYAETRKIEDSRPKPEPKPIREPAVSRARKLPSPQESVPEIEGCRFLECVDMKTLQDGISDDDLEELYAQLTGYHVNDICIVKSANPHIRFVYRKAA